MDLRDFSQNLWQKPPTDRTERLKKRLLKTRPILCSERARLATKAYQETEGQPFVFRRAKVLKRILEEMTVKILDDELIVGLFAEEQRGAPVFPETGTFWLEDELDSILETRSQDRFIVPEQVKQEIREILPWWRRRTLYDYVYGILPPEIKRARKANLFTLDLHERGGLGHVIPNYPEVLRKGFIGIRDETVERLNKADLSHPEDMKKSLFWKAVVEICDAVIVFAQRYSAEAKKLATLQTDSKRKKELEKIALICDRVPAHPSRNFYEALQAIWFIQLIIHLETNSAANSPGRLDQMLIDFFRRDIDAKELTLEDAQELADSLWIKFNEIIKVWDREATFVHAGFPMVQNVSLGGQTERADDGTNELTYLFLNAHRHVHLPQPHLTIRVRASTPDDLLMKATEVIKSGGGMPQLVNDELIVSSLLHRGVSLSDARTSSPIGCVEYGTIGSWGRNNGGYFNFPKVLELALNNGVERLTGEIIGIPTGGPDSFQSFDDVMEAYRRQLAHFLRLLVIEDNIIDMIHEQVMPPIYTSMLVPDCLEKGKDVTSGGARYNWTGFLGVGIANVADSLAAIKKIVFEDKRLTFTELEEALNTNFEGKEQIRQLLLHAPKYGNDDDYVDGILKGITDMYFNEAEKHVTYRGGHFVPGLFSLSVSLPFGWATGATPDGRKAKEPLADGVSPSHGCDVYGPTAVFKSVSKMDCTRVTNGMILNQKLNPMVLEGQGNAKKFIDLVKTYFLDLGGAQVQFNIVSAGMLKDAQRNPDKYRDLVIRVTGYSAFFTELSKEVQNDIIGRTEQLTL